MKDDSPIVLHVKAGDNTFVFFFFSLAIYEVFLYDKKYNPDAPSPDLYDETEIAFNRLQGQLLDASEDNGEVALSFAQFLILLSVVDLMSKALLEPDADRLIAYLAHKFPGLEDDWVSSYLHNAGYIFGAFRQQFGSLPKIEALLERITNLNGF